MKLKRKLKKISIGRDKLIVPWIERLNYFNDYFRPNGYTLETDIIDMNDSIIVMIGRVYNSDRIMVADGVAHKKTNEPFSFQKCQSGALNRALFILGIVDSEEDSIMDEDEASELQRNKGSSGSDIFKSMLAYVSVDYNAVEKRIPANKSNLTNEQIKELKYLINSEKSKKAIAQASK